MKEWICMTAVCLMSMVSLTTNADVKEIYTKANNAIVVYDRMYGIDEHLNLIVVNMNVEDINNSNNGNITTILITGKTYSIKETVEKFNTGTAYTVINDSLKEYKLYFTDLPIINIKSWQPIVDEPKIHALFTTSEKSLQTISDIGIELRGSTAQSFPKKSYRIEFWADSTGTEKKDVCLAGLRTDDDWNLLALYNEPLRMNNKTSADIWRKINTLSYQNKEAQAVNGSRMRYSEIFVNGSYQGIYCVAEPVDRKQLKLKKYDDDSGLIRGELYKGIKWGPAVFGSLPPYTNGNSIWANAFEYEYPDEIAQNWSNLYNLVDFVINSTNTEFFTNIPAHFNMYNAVDYFIFLNLSRACDNTGKNLFIAKYNVNEAYFYVPWDLDDTFGNYYDGTKSNVTNDILSNGLYDRLFTDFSENGFRYKLRTKWEALRKDWLTSDNLIQMFNANYDLLKKNGVYERESAACPNYKFDIQYTDYMREWITNRIQYLDTIFYNVTSIDKVEATENHGSCEISIFNTKGQLIKEVISTSPDLDIPGFNLSAGMYIFKIKTFANLYTKKIFVK